MLQIVYLSYLSLPLSLLLSMWQADETVSNLSLERSSFLAIQCVWTVVLVIFTGLHICSAFLLFLTVLFQLLFRCLLLDTLISRELRRGHIMYRLAYTLCSACGTGTPCMIWFVMGVKMVQLVVPVMGRAGSRVPPDLVIGGLMGFAVCIFTPYMVSGTEYMYIYIYI